MPTEFRVAKRSLRHTTCRLICVVALGSFCRADTEYYRHILFDNSLETDAYYYSEARASSPSSLEVVRGKLPVSHDAFFTPPNALRLKWRSAPNGGWEASIRAVDFRNREMKFDGEVLYFWCFSKDEIAGNQLPRIWLSDAGRGFSRALDMRKFQSSVPAGKW